MTGGTIGADSDNVKGGRAVMLFNGSVFDFKGGTLVTHSNTTYASRTVHLHTGTFNFSGGTVTADGGNTKQLRWDNEPTAHYNNTSGRKLNIEKCTGNTCQNISQ